MTTGHNTKKKKDLFPASDCILELLVIHSDQEIDKPEILLVHTRSSIKVLEKYEQLGHDQILSHF